MSHPVRAPTITKGSSSWKRTDKTKPVRSRWCGSARPPLSPVSLCRRRSVRSAGPQIAAHLPQTHTGHGRGLCGSPPPHPAELIRLVLHACGVALCCVFHDGEAWIHTRVHLQLVRKCFLRLRQRNAASARSFWMTVLK